MAKSLLHNRALTLRRSGKSLGQIAQELNISKDTASRWTKDIILTIDQQEKLEQRSIIGRERGRIINALNRKAARVNQQENAKKTGLIVLKKITRKELLVAGLALYAGEGVKAKREVRFCNTDPKIVNFMINWLINCFGVTLKDFHCSVGINESHREREETVKKYWSDITKIPLSSFGKTSFKKVASQKIYENFEVHYGTLDVRLLRSTAIHDRIMGLIYALFKPR